VIVGGCGSGTGNTVRSICCDANDSGSKLDATTSKWITGEIFFTISDFILFRFVLSVSLTVLKSPTMVRLTVGVYVVP
jgi:hypothetical protein